MSRCRPDWAQTVRRRLERQPPVRFDFTLNGDLKRVSAVLLLFGPGPGGAPELILNKRSSRVRQPGDLCCPGGGLAPVLDRLLAKGLALPFAPLGRWRPPRPEAGRRAAAWSKLTVLLAAALREGFEEMRLNPLGVRFLGAMPAEQLALYRRTIYPLVGWAARQQRFWPNWEVARIVRIPLADLLDPQRYARCQIVIADEAKQGPERPYGQMPCFVPKTAQGQEILWGATYRLVARFLATVLDFTPPPPAQLPVVHRRLDPSYLAGRERLPAA